MDKFNYETWWQLHLRIAKRETLTPEEQALYQAGNEHLDSEEADLVKGEWSSLYTIRAQIDQLQQRHTDLLHRSSELDAEIALLEENIQQLTGQSFTMSSGSTGIQGVDIVGAVSIPHEFIGSCAVWKPHLRSTCQPPGFRFNLSSYAARWLILKKFGDVRGTTKLYRYVAAII